MQVTTYNHAQFSLGIHQHKLNQFVPVLIMGGALSGWEGKQSRLTRAPLVLWFIPDSQEVSMVYVMEC